jgi:hypothetical protein
MSDCLIPVDKTNGTIATVEKRSLQMHANKTTEPTMRTAAHQKPGKAESRLAVAFMAILLIIGAGVFMRQYQINPAVVALRPDLHPQAPSSGPERPLLIDAADAGIEPFSQPERFTPETLYEKINGRADLYLSSGFVGLETQRFTADPAAGTRVEVFVYDMGTPENAFAVFSMQRRKGAASDDITPNAYRTENALFMALDKFYLEFIATEASQQLHEAIGSLAERFINAKGKADLADAPGAGLFPRKHRQSESLQLIAANAFGYEQLDQIYTCTYDVSGSRLTAFVSQRPDAGKASAMAANYRQTLLAYGASSVNADALPDGAAALQLFDTYEIVFSRGPYFAGVHEAENLEAAIILADRLAVHLEGLE